MSDLRYSKDHEWIRTEGEIGTVGISDYAQQQLGDVVFVELPELGRQVAKGAEAAVVESVKAASEVYAPVAGEVVAVNEDVVKDPSLVNKSPTGSGWFIKMRVSNKADLVDLMDDVAYAAYVKGLG